MKQTLIAATVAALTIPVAIAGPAYASNDIAVSVDNSQGTYPLSLFVNVKCENAWSSIGAKGAPVVVPAGGTLGEAPYCTLDSYGNGTYEFGVGANGQTVMCSGDINSPYVGGLQIQNATGDWECTYPIPDPDGAIFTGVNFFSFEKNDGVYNFSINPLFTTDGVNRFSVGVVAANDVNVGEGRSKNSGYMTLNPGRVTAMAKRFVDAPGSLINIHGYGLDRETSLARAEHVRDHLLAEITRLGGDPDEYPVMVIYAGDPAHKKGVHVTIQQHAASSITVPEGGTLTIGGNS